MPAPVDPVHLLALLTRVRAVRVAAGRLAAGRLYDVRAFKCCYAELGYLRRLAAAGRAGGTVVTSMRQLVAGLAPLHPAWRIDGEEGFQDRDRHHRAVRRRLDALAAMSLLRWRIGTDLDGDERRTELELRSAADVTVEELQAAARQLERWQARYGKALNTGSRTGIRNAAGHGRPLEAAERRRRGRHHACAAAASRRCGRGYKSNSAPPFGAPATPENTIETRLASELRNASQRTGVTQPDASQASTSSVTRKQSDSPGSGEGKGDPIAVADGAAARDGGSPSHGEGESWDPQALVARVRAREAERREMLEAIGGQASGRAVEVAGWGLERSWPVWRLREAWVVARWGPAVAAESGPAAAGPLYPDDHARLRRAVARYERNRVAVPDGYPARGLGALLHVGALAGSGELAGGPRTLRYAVGALDQLSRRMRAVATADSAKRAEHARDRAQRRRELEPPTRALALAFRVKWPPWVTTDQHGEPVFDRLGILQLYSEARGGVPAVDSESYRLVVRDAYLLAGRNLPVEVDGRKQMALRHQRQLDPAARRPALSDEQRELAELAHRTGEPLQTLARLAPSYRQSLLSRLRAGDARRAAREIIAFKAQLTKIADERR